MRRIVRGWTFVVALVALPAFARVARADVHGWTLCTPGSFNSCHSVAIGTSPILTGSVRTGTAVSISVTNLQGSGYPYDNTPISGLFQVFFSGRNFSMLMQPFFGSATATMSGSGASGGVTWQLDTGVQPSAAGIVNYNSLNSPNSGLIGGCASGPIGGSGFVTAANTCGTGAFAIFNFDVGTIFDAGQMETAFVEAVGENDFGYCFSDPSAFDPQFPACDVHDEYLQTTVTPEPVSVALLGTGLVGLGGAWRRRKVQSS